ncbi:Allantoinase [Cryptotrichosporon argae]
MSNTLTVLAPRAVLPGHAEPQAATITVDRESGKIVDVQLGLRGDIEGDALRVAGTELLLPGLIDTHVHLNEPGRTEWEGFETGTSAALSGGVTTLVDMPLNAIPPTTTVGHLTTKRAAARGKARCDVGFWGGIIPGNAGELRPLWDEGVKGFKCFLIESGVEEFPCVTEQDLEFACQALDGTDALILFHAELETHPHEHPHEAAPAADGTAYATFLSSRPVSLELSALDLVMRLARRYPALRFHIVHLSAAEAVPRIRAAHTGADGGAPVRNLTVETCFHYLCLSAEDVPANATQYKCCPPIRDERNRRLMVDAVMDGVVDFVVSDHSPCVPELKRGDFMSAWGGVSGLGLGLSLLWSSELRQLGIVKVVDLLSGRQARQVRLDGQKGIIAPGADADFVVFDPDATLAVTLDSLLFRNKVSPYLGRTLTGKVRQTYVGGRLAYDEASGVKQVPVKLV